MHNRKEQLSTIHEIIMWTGSYEAEGRFTVVMQALLCIWAQLDTRIGSIPAYCYNTQFSKAFFKP